MSMERRPLFLLVRPGILGLAALVIIASAPAAHAQTVGIGLIDDFMNKFVQALGAGFNQLQPELNFLTSTMATISLVGLGLYYATSDGGEHIFPLFARKALFVGVISWLIKDWHTLTNEIEQSLIQIGLLTAGGGVSPQDFANPSNIALKGINAAVDLAGNFGRVALSGLWGGPATALFDALLLAVAVIMVFAAFISIALQIVYLTVKFQVVSFIGALLITFCLFSGTAFLAQRVPGQIFSAGIEVLVLAIVVAIGAPFFAQLTLPFDPSPISELTLVAAAAVFWLFATKLPREVAAIVAGGPNFAAYAPS